MNEPIKGEPIEHQVLRGPDGEPLYAVIPWDVFVERFGAAAELDDEVTIPHAVIKIEETQGCSIIRAWREHLGLTQAGLAERMGISRAAYAQMEAVGANPRPTTLKKIAAAMGVNWRQIQD
ncbi:helix-turn-helix domain-containing protein [Oceanidesulfovibrio marinus]|uniref:Transcriptional regulator n=1 Tax=Oceanidesulfovibrio marinus TaxID=370038 RepID=A0A6P1ZJ02_9BACT|nr:helix-turn-helix transcriptional regulator [Oceanidesulfovibrio marinus]QJT07439.1 helix-turn-helix transcriptional regulator [Oceanidesulfovibrio marinus]TVM34647.1 transcriptional regulator [Oceanidesulfovibrio marinus]